MWLVATILGNTSIKPYFVQSTSIGTISSHFQANRAGKINPFYRWENRSSGVCSSFIYSKLSNYFHHVSFTQTWPLTWGPGKMVLTGPHSGSTIKWTRHFLTFPSYVLKSKRDRCTWQNILESLGYGLLRPKGKVVRIQDPSKLLCGSKSPFFLN